MENLKRKLNRLQKNIADIKQENTSSIEKEKEKVKNLEGEAVTDQEITDRVMYKMHEEGYDAIITAPFIKVIVRKTLEALVDIGIMKIKTEGTS